MFYTDTRRALICAYDFDLDKGVVANRCVFAAVPAERGEPDGMTVDSAGHVWSANWDGWNGTRCAPDGTVDRIVRLPVQRSTSCAFGGSDLKTLYITSSRDGLTAADLAAQPLAGGIFALDVAVPGLAEPRFAG